MNDKKIQAAIEQYNADIVAAVATLERIAQDLQALERQAAGLRQAQQQASLDKLRAQAALEAVQALVEQSK